MVGLARLARSVSNEPKSAITSVVALFTKAAHRLQHIPLLIVDSNGEELCQLAEELRHLVRREFQGAVQIDAIEHRCRTLVLRPLDGLRESEPCVANHCQLDRSASPWAAARLLDTQEFNVKTHVVMLSPSGPTRISSSDAGAFGRPNRDAPFPARTVRQIRA